jgi:hypothetical protein
MVKIYENSLAASHVLQTKSQKTVGDDLGGRRAGISAIEFVMDIVGAEK